MRADKRPSAGFTLIELVIVMVIIAVGLLGMTSLFSNTSTSLSTNETLQQATQYAQECAEKAITTRRSQGFSWFASNTFTCGTAPTGFNRTANPVSAICTSASVSPDCSTCPSGMNCRRVDITVSSTTPGLTNINSSITLLLVNY